jgi:hypothetical protein
MKNLIKEWAKYWQEQPNTDNNVNADSFVLKDIAHDHINASIEPTFNLEHPSFSNHHNYNIEKYTVHYKVYITDPNNIIDDIPVLLNIKTKILIMEYKAFDLLSPTGIIDFKNYLYMGRQTSALAIKYNEIINKFINDTNLTLQDLQACGLPPEAD